MLADYKRREKEAHAEADAIIGYARQEAERIAAEGKAKVEEFVARRTKLAESKIAQAEAQAMVEVRTIAAEAAVERRRAPADAGGQGQARRRPARQRSRRRQGPDELSRRNIATEKRPRVRPFLLGAAAALGARSRVAALEPRHPGTTAGDEPGMRVGRNSDACCADPSRGVKMRKRRLRRLRAGNVRPYAATPPRAWSSAAPACGRRAVSSRRRRGAKMRRAVEARGIAALGRSRRGRAAWR